jgi:hypothetical protein
VLHQATFAQRVMRRSRSLSLVLAQLAGGRTGAGPHLQHVCRRWPARKSLSIRPFAPSDNFTSALTSAFARVDDDLVVAGTQGGLRACRPTYL